MTTDHIDLSRYPPTPTPDDLAAGFAIAGHDIAPALKLAQDQYGDPSVFAVDRSSRLEPAVWRWQPRFAEQGVDGLLRDKTRKPGRAPLSARVVAKVMDLTCSEPPGDATHSTAAPCPKPSASTRAAVLVAQTSFTGTRSGGHGSVLSLRGA